MIRPLKYCYVTGGSKRLNFHSWLSDESIIQLKKDGCNVKIIRYSKYQDDWLYK